MPPTGKLLSPTGKKVTRPDPHVVSPEVAKYYAPSMARLGAALLAERAARYTAGADAAWAELKQLERTDCRMRVAREQAK